MQWDEAPFEFGFQTVLMSQESLESFRSRMEYARELGFLNLELNVPVPEQRSPAEITEAVKACDMNISSFASGATASVESLSLSSSDEATRERSVLRAAELAEYAQSLEANMIAGFLKGSAVEEKSNANLRFRTSLEELAPRIPEDVRLLVECTNHYETHVANTVEDGRRLIAGLPGGAFCVLADTYHMNIEEQCTRSALLRLGDDIPTIHFSDNNRRFPGRGAIDFKSLMQFLVSIEFSGVVTLEGMDDGDFKSAIADSAAYLKASLACI